MVRRYVTLAASHVTVQHRKFSPMDKMSTYGNRVCGTKSSGNNKYKGKLHFRTGELKYLDSVLVYLLRTGIGMRSHWCMIVSPRHPISILIVQPRRISAANLSSVDLISKGLTAIFSSL